MHTHLGTSTNLIIYQKKCTKYLLMIKYAYKCHSVLFWLYHTEYFIDGKISQINLFPNKAGTMTTGWQFLQDSSSWFGQADLDQVASEKVVAQISVVLPNSEISSIRLVLFTHHLIYEVLFNEMSCDVILDRLGRCTSGNQ